MKPDDQPRRPYALDAHHRAAIACTMAVLAFILLRGHTTLPAQLILTWDAFACTTIVMAWTCP